MKKRYIAIAIAVVVVAVLPWYRLLLYGKETSTERIERVCGIELPKEMDMEYDYYNKAFHGDFTSYTVFQLKEEPTWFLNVHSFLSKETEYHIENILRNHKIPKKYYPDEENECLVKEFMPRDKNGRYNGVYVLAFYFPDTAKFIFLMDIM
ncbi:MAG: hypothetical protein LBL66_03640 [Clostridiales bacterium]|jgi:hypothetical protein|nr:hypothetical protein [Clostridiales bacterium]